jgi:PKD repeat protein
MGQTLTYNSYGSSGPIAGAVWDFGDGSPAVYDAQEVTHIYNAPGTYRLSLTVQGEQIGTGSDTAAMYVVVDLGPEPEHVKAAVNGPGSGQVGESLTFDSYGSSGPIASSVWDFGDGSAPVYDASQVTHIYNAPGTYRVSLTVQGEHLGSGDTAFIDVQIFEKQPR